MIHLIIHQIDDTGTCWREFQHYKRDDELDAYLARVERAYNMTRTGVTDPDGALIAGVEPHHEAPAGARFVECDG